MHLIGGDFLYPASRDHGEHVPVEVDDAPLPHEAITTTYFWL